MYSYPAIENSRKQNRAKPIKKYCTFSFRGYIILDNMLSSNNNTFYVMKHTFFNLLKNSSCESCTGTGINTW